MNDHNLPSHVKAAVTESLITLGWSGLTSGTALAIKRFQTAVGVRDAHAYLKDYGPDTLRFALDGDYNSEGRNQLESHGVLIPKRADAETIQRMVTHFASSVDAAVGQTYARRLLTSRQPEPLNVLSVGETAAVAAVVNAPAPPYPGGVTEVLIDIAECLAAQRLTYPGDSRDRYEILWDWAVEFEAQFQAKIQADDGPNPQDTYYEDVDNFAVAKATADGWDDNKLLPTPYASPSEAPLLSVGEQTGLLQDPAGLIRVMWYHELNEIQCDARGEPRYDMGRHAELKAMGRKMIEGALEISPNMDIWPPEALQAFGVQVPPSDPAMPSA